MSFNYSPTYDYPKRPQHPPEDDSDAPILPLGDQNSWYYPSHGNDSDEEPLAPGSTSGNWGNKTSAGARWIRRGKIASWGPGMEDWEAEDRARKRVKRLLPTERRSASPPVLPHLSRSPSPPLVSPYSLPNTQHLSYSSFVMDKAATHSFRNNLLDELEHSNNNLIEGEVVLRRALGRLWQVLSEDPDEQVSIHSVVPKREDEEDEEPDEQARRVARAPDLTPLPHRIFLLPYPDSLSGFEQSHFASPQVQLETLEKSLATLRELQDDGREYVERLQEIREGLGDVRANRNTIWDFVRAKAVGELREVAFAAGDGS